MFFRVRLQYYNIYVHIVYIFLNNMKVIQYIILFFIVTKIFMCSILCGTLNSSYIKYKEYILLDSMLNMSISKLVPRYCSSLCINTFRSSLSNL